MEDVTQKELQKMFDAGYLNGKGKDLLIELNKG
jgi:hypothetical protein